MASQLSLRLSWFLGAANGACLTTETPPFPTWRLEIRNRDVSRAMGSETCGSRLSSLWVLSSYRDTQVQDRAPQVLQCCYEDLVSKSSHFLRLQLDMNVCVCVGVSQLQRPTWAAERQRECRGVSWDSFSEEGDSWPILGGCGDCASVPRIPTFPG